MKIIKHEKRLKALGMEKLCRWDFAHDNRGILPMTTDKTPGPPI